MSIQYFQCDKRIHYFFSILPLTPVKLCIKLMQQILNDLMDCQFQSYNVKILSENFQRFKSKMVQYHSTMSKKQYKEKYFSLFFQMQENILHFNKYKQQKILPTPISHLFKKIKVLKDYNIQGQVPDVPVAHSCALVSLEQMTKFPSFCMTRYAPGLLGVCEDHTA